MYSKIDEDDLWKIINHFGKPLQLLKLSEESGEVSRAIIRKECGVTLTNHEITEEISDLLVVINQLMLLYDVDEKEVEQIMKYKVIKTMDKYNIN
jgi:NTP pyrophosphatase (non-canonical NTP hydrolase)